MPGTIVTVGGKKVRILKNTKVKPVPPQEVELSNDVLFLILLEADPRTLFRLCQSNTNLNNICQGTGIWKARIKKEFDISVPEGPEGSDPRKYYMNLITPRTFTVIMYPYTRSERYLSLKLSRQTSVEEIHRLISSGYEKVRDPTMARKYDPKSVVFALGEVYPYQLVTKEDWQKAFDDKATYLTLYSSNGAYAIIGFLHLGGSRGDYYFPINKEDMLFMLFRLVHKVLGGDIELSIPIFMIKDMNLHWVGSPDFPHKFTTTRWSLKESITTIFKQLGFETNYQGLFPIIHGTYRIYSRDEDF